MKSIINRDLLLKQDELNAFTAALKEHIHANGRALCRLRNKDLCEVVFRPADEQDGREDAFESSCGRLWWYLNGKSPQSCDFDLIEATLDGTTLEAARSHGTALRRIAEEGDALSGQECQEIAQAALNLTRIPKARWVMSDGSIRSLTDQEAAVLAGRRMFVTTDPPPANAMPVRKLVAGERRP